MVELWLIDTGCAHDLGSLADVARSGDRLRPLTENINFQTLNGGTVSTPMQIAELSERINPYVLKESPASLSIGDRTMNQGYPFVWPAYRNPYFITPDGFRVELEVIDDIPFLRRGSDVSKPTPLRDFGQPRTPRRSRQASPAADMGGSSGGAEDNAIIGDCLEAPAGIIVEPPPPPVLNAEQEAQRVARRDLKAVAFS
eukprot:11029836-Heterocapsa_arctica.AAC.1